MIGVFYNILCQNCGAPPPTQHQPQYWRENMAGQENEKLTKQPNIIVGGIFFSGRCHMSGDSQCSGHGISDNSKGTTGVYFT